MRTKVISAITEITMTEDPFLLFRHLLEHRLQEVIDIECHRRTERKHSTKISHSHQIVMVAIMDRTKRSVEGIKTVLATVIRTLLLQTMREEVLSINNKTASIQVKDPTLSHSNKTSNISILVKAEQIITVIIISIERIRLCRSAGSLQTT